MAHRRRPGWVWWTVGLLGGGAVVAVQFLPIRSAVEDSLTSRSRTALTEAGYPGLDVAFSGRDGVVSGPLDPADTTAVEGIVREVTGVRVVRVESGLAAARPGSEPTSTGSAAASAAASPTGDPSTSTLASPSPSPSVTVQVRTPSQSSAPEQDATASSAATATTPASTGTAVPPTTEPTPATPPPATPPPASPPPALATPPPPPGVDAAFAALPPIAFESSRFGISADSEPIVQAIADIITAGPAAQRYEVRAHTDTTGSAGGNQWLSDQRAASVVAALLARGVGADRLSGTGLGESQPLVSPEVSADDRARNRRVEIVAVP